MKIATEKVWIAEDGKTLVADGDPKAASLLAAKSQRVSLESLATFRNAEEFFEDEIQREEPSIKKRVEPDPAPVHQKAPHIKGK